MMKADGIAHSHFNLIFPNGSTEAIETSHWDLSLALLSAVVEAFRQQPEHPGHHAPTVPRVRSMRDDALLCETSPERSLCSHPISGGHNGAIS